MGARLCLEGVMVWGGGRQLMSSSDSLHRFRLEFLNPHKSFILVRKYCFEWLEQPNETAGSQGTCLRLPAVPLTGASWDHKKLWQAGLWLPMNFGGAVEICFCLFDVL